MFEINAKLDFMPNNVTKKHQRQSSWKHTAIAKLEKDDTHSYYAWFLQKRFNLPLVNPLRGSHVTIVSDMMDHNLFQEASKIFNGREIKLMYDPSEIRTNGRHWWIKIYSKDAENIRTAMGLTPTPYFNFHLTLGDANEKYIEHSKYILDCIKFYGL